MFSTAAFSLIAWKLMSQAMYQFLSEYQYLFTTVQSQWKKETQNRLNTPNNFNYKVNLCCLSKKDQVRKTYYMTKRTETKNPVLYTKSEQYSHK